MNGCGLVTNEYALADLSRATLKHPDMTEHKDTIILTAEDLVLCAFSEGKLSFNDVQDLINRWTSAGEHIMSIKKQDFISKGFKIEK